jgi:hypothetical protein
MGIIFFEVRRIPKDIGSTAPEAYHTLGAIVVAIPSQFELNLEPTRRSVSPPEGLRLGVIEPAGLSPLGVGLLSMDR